MLDYNVGKYKIYSESILQISLKIDQALDCIKEDDYLSILSFKLSKDSLYNEDSKTSRVFKRISETPLLNFKKGVLRLESEGYMERFNERKSIFKCGSGRD